MMEFCHHFTCFKFRYTERSCRHAARWSYIYQRDGARVCGCCIGFSFQPGSKLFQCLQRILLCFHRGLSLIRNYFRKSLMGQLLLLMLLSNLHITCPRRDWKVMIIFAYWWFWIHQKKMSDTYRSVPKQQRPGTLHKKLACILLDLLYTSLGLF